MQIRYMRKEERIWFLIFSCCPVDRQKRCRNLGKEKSIAPPQTSLKLFRFFKHLPGHIVKKDFFVLICSFDYVPFFTPKSITAFYTAA